MKELFKKLTDNVYKKTIALVSISSLIVFLFIKLPFIMFPLFLTIFIILVFFIIALSWQDSENNRIKREQSIIAQQEWSDKYKFRK